MGSLGAAPLLDSIADNHVRNAEDGDPERSERVDGGCHAGHQGPEADHEKQCAVVLLSSPSNAGLRSL